MFNGKSVYTSKNSKASDVHKEHDKIIGYNPFNHKRSVAAQKDEASIEV